MATQFAAFATPIILAHQGGWDEILLIAGPILVIVALLMIAKKRVDAAAGRMGPAPDPESATPAGTEPATPAGTEPGIEPGGTPDTG